MSHRFPTLFIPHGGGPCFFMDPFPGLPVDLWDRMAAYLRGIDRSIGVRPEAVLVVSGHWEELRPTVNTASHHTLLFDYSGFPDEMYRLTYPANGSPRVAARVRQLLAEAGVETGEDAKRGLDHGVFVPFKLVYPAADVPIVQLSLNHTLDPAAHLAMGAALAPLRDEGVLIVGSGMSYHNLRYFMVERESATRSAEAFDGWLYETVTAADVAARTAGLTAWRNAPGATDAHPRSEHLLPLMVAAGAAGGDRGVRTYSDRLIGKPLSGFQFG
jgi:aromatic ring-opening dioxygenase catalytic subunit (LigB family)